MEFNFLELARKAALKAGEIIMAFYEEGFSVEQKADHSPVTEADREADRMIRKVLGVSGIPVISEETVQVPYEERRNWNLFWMVDPLDGTKEFVKKKDEFCINIALVREGNPTDGLVFVPVMGLIYATDNGKLLRETWTGDKAGSYDTQAERTELNKGTYSVNICTSVSHSNPITVEYIRRYGSSFPSGQILRLGSAWKFGFMVEGKAGLYPRFSPTYEWDTAAGHALLRAAGGNVIDAQTGHPLVYNKPDPVNPPFLAFLPPFDRETAMKFVP